MNYIYVLQMVEMPEHDIEWKSYKYIYFHLHITASKCKPNNMFRGSNT